MSWESSLEYYKLLNQGVEQRLGGLHSARLVLSSVEFAELTELQRAGRWDDVATVLADAARGRRGRPARTCCSCARPPSTPSPTRSRPPSASRSCTSPTSSPEACQAPRARARVGLHRHVVRDAAAVLRRPARLPRPAGRRPRRSATTTRSTRSSTASWCTARSSTPRARTVVGVIDELWDAGAEGVILGCTELELLVKQADCEMPVFPCTTLHVEAALDRALAG